MSRVIVPLAIAALFAVPTLSSAKAPAEAVEFRARTTVSMAEVAENSAQGLATPVGIASGDSRACEVRCVLAEDAPAANADGAVALRCEVGEVRSVDTRRGFDVLARWSDDGAAAFSVLGDVDLSRCE